MRTCLYCGNEIKQRYNEYTPYWECDCVDAKKNKEIDEQIFLLERSKPKFKYKKQEIIVKIKL